VIAADLADEHPSDQAALLQRLVEGNDRFARDAPRPQHVGREWRQRLTKQQHPYATILSCSDSRVPPELIFDEGFGDLFVIRVAGHVVAHDALGSLAYAAEHLHTRLFVVMGHEACGAVTAAVESMLGQANEPEHIESLVNLITPGLVQLNRQQPRRELIAAAVEANVRWSMERVAHCPQVAKLLEAKSARLVGAVYELESGRVRFLKPV
jgi:carbonic anhydrase